jgi:transcription elongation factor Elf1
MKHQIKIQPKKATVECLSCNRDINVGHNTKIGSIVTCVRCNMSFEIIELNPLLIDWPYYDDDYFDGDYSDEDEYEY